MGRFRRPERISMIARTSYRTSYCAGRRTSDATVLAAALSHNNGSQITNARNSVMVTYDRDLQGHLVSIDNTSDSQVDVTYAYNSDGVRVAETANGTTTYYLNDPQNPTGYTKAIEERVSTNPNAPATSYILSLQVIGQVSSTATYNLLVDGHGSTRALTSTTSSVVEGYNYDAYGTLLGFVGTPKTNWQFGGDGMWDPNSLFTYHLARFRDGERFISYDTFEADPTTPARLHKYVYCNSNPINGIDPSGQFTLIELLIVVLGIALIASLVYYAPRYLHALKPPIPVGYTIAGIGTQAATAAKVRLLIDTDPTDEVGKKYARKETIWVDDYKTIPDIAKRASEVGGGLLDYVFIGAHGGASGSREPGKVDLAHGTIPDEIIQSEDLFLWIARPDMHAIAKGTLKSLAGLAKYLNDNSTIDFMSCYTGDRTGDEVELKGRWERFFETESGKSGIRVLIYPGTLQYQEDGTIGTPRH